MSTSSMSHIKQPLKRIAVIGGGAAGYFSGIEVANYLKNHLTNTNTNSPTAKSPSSQTQYEVVIFESSRTPLSKVLISGGGRCNVMHDPRKGAKIISKGYPRGHRELLGPMSCKFGPDETYQWFTSRGIELKVEEDGRVFPTSDRAESIIEVLENQAKLSQVQIMASAQVLGIHVLSNDCSNNTSSSSSSSRSSNNNNDDERAYNRNNDLQQQQQQQQQPSSHPLHININTNNNDNSINDDEMNTNTNKDSSKNYNSNSRHQEPLFAVKYRKSKSRTVISPYSHIDKSTSTSSLSNSNKNNNNSNNNNNNKIRDNNNNNNDNSNDDDNNINNNNNNNIINDDDDDDCSIYECDRVIFATGSNRAGYTMLEKLGHTISPPLPSLFSFKIKDELLTSLSGLPIPEAIIKVVFSKTNKAKCSSILNGAGGNYISTQLEQKGPVMITHQGISGPGVLKLSAYGAAILAALNYQVEVDINWLPAVTGGGIDSSTGNIQTSVQQLIGHFNYQKLRNPNKLVASWFPPVVLPVEMSEDDDNDWSSSGSSSKKIKNDDDDGNWSIAKDIIVSRSSDSTTTTAAAVTTTTPLTSRSGMKNTVNNFKNNPKNTINNANTNAVADSGEGTVAGEAGLPRRLWKYILLKSGITEELQAGLKWGTVSKTQIQTIASQVLKQRHTVTGRGMYRDEFVTCGGVSLKQVNFDTMESRLVKGLFLCGEVIDIDGITGGYNFQAAWTGGWIAGHNCAQSLISNSSSDNTATTSSDSSGDSERVDPVSSKKKKNSQSKQ